MKASKIISLASLAAVLLLAFTATAAPKKILFFTKSSGFEHEVISWKKSQPGFAEKVLLELGQKNNWEFTFSKDGAKFSPDYLNQFDAVFFYTTGDLCSEGTDKNPAMSAAGKQALFDYVRSGKGFVGTHAATDTFHTDNESKKGPDRYANHGTNADAYAQFIGAEFIIHGAQQVATNTVLDSAFPGFENVGANFAFIEEWYSLKDFSPDIQVLTVMEAPHMKGSMYERPAYPNTWARNEGKGRVWYTSMGHREDVWTNPTFQQILVGGLKWAIGEVAYDLKPNLLTAAPGAYTNPKYVEPKPAAAAKLNTLTPQEKAAGWKLLWNGKNGDGWRSAKSENFPEHGWTMQDGVLTVNDNKGEESTGGGDIITRKRYAQFELTAEFKLTPGANSGLKFFVQPNLKPIDKVTGKPAAVGSAIGMEFQVLDDALHPDAKLGKDGNRKLGSLYDLIPAPADKVTKPIGEWNTARILSEGKHVTYWLNGTKTVEFERGSENFRQHVAESKFKNIPEFGEWADGHILLQEHGNEVSFRNVKIRELSGK